MSHIVNWHYPTEIYCGINARENIFPLLNQQEIVKPILLVDKFLLTIDAIKSFVDKIQADLNAVIFDEVSPNPTLSDLTQAMALCQREQCDAVICLGGGSVLDVGKSLALLAYQGLHPWELEDLGSNYLKADNNKILPSVAIPTTAGTGSEVGRAALIIDEEKKRKRFIFHPEMLPNMVILDPQLTVTMPPHLTAATGMDALAHNLEALCAPGFHPMADGVAMQGLKVIKENLHRAYQYGDDLDARNNMLVASMMGGTAFQKGLGAVHSLSHPVGAYYKAHHGLLNAIFMPYVMQYNKSTISDKIESLAKFLGLPRPSFTAVLDWLLALRESLNLPHTLVDINIPISDYDKLADEALLDPSTASNPKKLEKIDFKKLLDNATTGVL